MVQAVARAAHLATIREAKNQFRMYRLRMKGE